MEPEAFGRRAILKKTGSPDIRIEVRRNSAFDFSTVEDGIPTGPVLRKFSPRELMSGVGPAPMTIDDAWRVFLSKFPHYSETDRRTLSRCWPGNEVEGLARVELAT